MAYELYRNKAVTRERKKRNKSGSAAVDCPGVTYYFCGQPWTGREPSYFLDLPTEQYVDLTC